MKARSTSSGNLNFSSRTSTSTTLAPAERNAFETPRPVASDTSRSEPGPPIKTAILCPESSDFMTVPPTLRVEKLSCRFSHDLHFCFELDAAFLPRRRFDFVDQLQHLIRGRAAVINNEVAMHLRHACFAPAPILYSE